MSHFVLTQFHDLRYPERWKKKKNTPPKYYVKAIVQRSALQVPGICVNVWKSRDSSIGTAPWGPDQGVLLADGRFSYSSLAVTWWIQQVKDWADLVSPVTLPGWAPCPTLNALFLSISQPLVCRWAHNVKQKWAFSECSDRAASQRWREQIPFGSNGKKRRLTKFWSVTENYFSLLK